MLYSTGCFFLLLASSSIGVEVKVGGGGRGVLMILHAVVLSLAIDLASL